MSLLNYFKRIENPAPNPEANKKKHNLEEDDKENTKKLKIESVQEKKELVPAHLALEKKYMAEDWYKAFRSEMLKGYFIKIKKFLENEKKNKVVIFPEEKDMYSFTKCPLKQIRVVILGQDPYHGVGQAHGLCFSVKKGVQPPPSLVNIFRELKNDLGDNFKIPNHGYLNGWTEQGVLLLNTSLSVRKGEAASHANIGWQQFTDAIISYINQCRRNVVFLLWGSHAQKKGKNIDKNKHLVLKAVHPSPLSANRGGWFGCKHFSKTNEYLIKNGYKPIDWSHLP
ncbi:hypothetical protein BCR32DRAFT_297128 [Anaeromyces robustus]|uniref:Uracil-DNA glycosylase n=1 Tax=Anaeromyces robustus TaxID=1754192 RepID=A0A1Y1WND6_9FUNG|nr:hypothetical protein BCR32DRAFT_297128 [Anaeromyces robustus]|eukprot:ORX75079.1 hypothetical protein BCR32DRAFT_297128 [Anaeromyces robustus]